MLKMIKNLFILMSSFLTGCTGIPDNVTAVNGFELNRYLGTWYEIARLDHSFERGMDNISATYSPREDGGIDVLNKGREQETGVWEQAEGKAYFIGSSDIGRLKVSFFGPFYGGYNIIALDRKSYTYALVTGPDRSYLWILARKPNLPPNMLKQLISLAEKLGYDTKQLIYVTHDTSLLK